MVQTEQTPSLRVGASHDDRRVMPSLRVFNDPRLPLVTFVAVEVAVLVRVLVLAPGKWFAYDEWGFLAGGVHGLFRPWIGHWLTLPILVWRGLYQLFGLRTYLPYEMVLVVLHLTAAALLLVVIRRLGVNAWIATVAASLFALFGAGWQDIIWAFQIDFVGALVLGLTHMLLADHDGRIDRRDWLGLLAGCAALMCSGVGVIMALVVGLATFTRRGWRVALFHTVPLAALYVAWWFFEVRAYYHGLATSMDPGLLARWSWIAIRSSFEALGQYTGMGIVLAVLLVVGLALAWIPLDLAQLRTRAAVPAALLFGGIVLVVGAGWQRNTFHVFKIDHAGDSQYLYLFVAMALPALAVAADAIGRRWRPLLPVVVVVFLIGIPGNFEAFATAPTGLFRTEAETSYRQTVVALATVPVARQVPRSTKIYDLTGLFHPSPPIGVTLGWLLDQKAEGRLPSTGPLDPVVEADATLSLALQQSQGGSGSVAIGATSSPAAQGATAAPTGRAPFVRVADNAKDGPILVDSSGMTLYTLTNGYQPQPCTGTCGHVWSPLLAPPGSAAPTGGPGVSGLGKTASGTVVTYFGYPLFLYPGDKAPGQTNGDDVRSFGGTWHVIKVQAPKSCSPLVATTRVLEKGESIVIAGSGLGVIYQAGRVQSDEVIFEAAKGNTLSVLAGPLTVQLLPVGSKSTLALCM